MTLLGLLQARFPRLFPVLAAVAALGTAGGYAAQAYAADSCCYPGSPCCYPGSPCCGSHHKTQR